MQNLSLIVIDPQVGFCQPDGSLGLAYGAAELREIQTTLHRIQGVFAQKIRRHLVISEYSIGQFCEGNTAHPLAYLCVPEVNQDCRIVDELANYRFDSTSIKHSQSALSSEHFCAQIDADIASGCHRFVVTGFLLEHCVTATVIDLLTKLKHKNADVIICSDLVASRAEKYRDGTVQAVERKLSKLGVKFQVWSDIEFSLSSPS